MTRGIKTRYAPRAPSAPVKVEKKVENEVEAPVINPVLIVLNDVKPVADPPKSPKSPETIVPTDPKRPVPMEVTAVTKEPPPPRPMEPAEPDRLVLTLVVKDRLTLNSPSNLFIFCF